MPDFLRRLLYRQVKEHILHQLSLGKWKAGDILPSEREFALQLKVSQGTVRKAIEELVDENVLYREQGRGTFVQSFLSMGYKNQFHRFFHDDLNQIVPFSMRLVGFEYVPAKKADRIAHLLRLTSEDRLIHALRVYSWQDYDVGISELWLDAKRFSLMNEGNLANHKGSLYQYYERELGVTVISVHDEIKAGVFKPNHLQFGQFTLGAPYLKLMRTSYTFGMVPVEYRVSYCSTEHFHMVIR